MSTKSRAMPVLETIRAKAVKRRDRDLVSSCDQLLEEAAEEVSDHRRLRKFPSFGGRFFTLASTGPLGRAVLLLYCESLFLNQRERLECVYRSDGCVQLEDLDRLATAAAQLRSVDLSPLNDNAIFHTLRRVCTTPYFLKEDVNTVSRVFTKMKKFEPGWHLWCKLTLPMRRAYAHASAHIHYDPKHARKLDFDNMKPVQYFLRMDPAELLAGLHKSTALTMLVVRRPAKSLLPHGEAAMVCIEHALMWLNAPHLNVFHPLKLTYSDLSASMSESDHSSFYSHWDARIPSSLDRVVRHSVIESYSSRSCATDQEVHFLKLEDFYKHPDLSEKQLQVFKTLPFAYRSKPEELEHNRLKTCKIYAEICKEVMPLEPPQYRHLFE